MSSPYEDIINRPHHTSTARPQMSLANRAAQFSPFAALAGFNSAVKETARLTDDRIELGEDDIAMLNMKLQMLEDAIADCPRISITSYAPDEKKTGGAYTTVSGSLKKIDDIEHALILTRGEKIYISDILNIECSLFD